MLIIAPWNYPVQLLLGPLIPALAAGNTAVAQAVGGGTGDGRRAGRPGPALPRRARRAGRDRRRRGDDRTARPSVRPHLLHRQRHGRPGRHGGRRRPPHAGDARARRQEPGDRHRLRRRRRRAPVASPGASSSNAGQTCVAPDYVLVPESLHDRFVAELATAVTTFFGDDPATSHDYGRIVNERHHARLVRPARSWRLRQRSPSAVSDDAESRYIAPTVLTGVKPDAAVMDDEIFGPILPVLRTSSSTMRSRSSTIGPKPLALYVFGSTSGRHRPGDRAHVGRRRDGQPHAAARRPSPSSHSAASAPAASAPTTGRPASTSSRTPSRSCSARPSPTRASPTRPTPRSSRSCSASCSERRPHSILGRRSSRH